MLNAIPTFIRRSLATAAITLTIGTFATDAHAISYQVFNHPDGNAIPVGKTVDEGGYVLRLDLGNQLNTFNANHTQLTFNFDPGTTTATITGLVTHNQSGEKYKRYDDFDDVYRIDATLSGVVLTERGSVAPWFGYNSDSQTYNDMVSDLLTDANNPRSAEEQSHAFSDNVARISFQWDSLTLAPVTINGLGQTYTGPLSWTEKGDPFLLQYRWRLWDDTYAGDQFDLLAAAGWLQADTGVRGTHDWLMVLGKKPTPPGGGGAIPEPTTTLLASLALGVLATRLRRRKFA